MRLAIAGGAALVLGGLLAYSFLIEPEVIDVNVISIDGTGNDARIVFISDFQRRNADPAFVARAVSLINGQEPDLVLMGGDYVHDNTGELPSIGPLGEIESELGVWGVLGNHDYDIYGFNHRGADLVLAGEVREYLESMGISIVQNETILFQNMSVTFLGSYWAGMRDDSLLDEQRGGYRIVLAHNQNNLGIDGGGGDLYLFGHTHCGQVRLPVLGSVPKMLGFEGEYDYRHYTVDGADVYTTCGLAPAPRFLNPPEITVINLS